MHDIENPPVHPAREWANISAAIMFYAELHPERPAVVDGAQTLNYRHFAELIRQAAVYLRKLGIAAGDLVGVALVNSADHLILFFGLLRLGASPVALAPETAPDALAALLRKYRISPLFIGADAPSNLAPLEVRLDLHWQASLAAHQGDANTELDSDACLQISLTSGSTGLPRAIVCTQRQRMARATAYQKTYADRWSADRPAPFLLTMAISNSGFLQFLINQIMMGGTVVILPYYQHASDFVRMVAAWDDAVCVATPDMCRAFLRHARDGEMLLPRLRALFSAGLPLSAADKQRLIGCVTQHFYDAYGASGAGMISILRPPEVLRHAETVGRPCEDAGVEIVDAQGQPVAPGEVGQVRCAGATVAQGWLALEDARPRAGEAFRPRAGEAFRPPAGEAFRPPAGEAFRDGFYYPGDIAAFDAENYLILKGRATDLIQRHGQALYPGEIENVITAHPMVQEVAVVGRGSGDEEEVVAYVVLGGQLPHEELARHCARHLPAAKRPGAIYYTASLPRTPNGKLDRPAIRRFSEAAPEEVLR